MLFKAFLLESIHTHFSGHWQLNITDNPILLTLTKTIGIFCIPHLLLGWNWVNKMSKQFLAVQQNHSVRTVCLAKAEAQDVSES